MVTQGSPGHLQQCGDASEGQEGGENMMLWGTFWGLLIFHMFSHMFIAGSVDIRDGLSVLFKY